MRLWYLSHGRPAKTQASLRIRAVSPEPLLFAHMEYESRRWARYLAPLDGCAWAFEEWVYGGRKVPLSHEMVQTSPYVSRLMTKPAKWHVHPAKTQISLGIRPVWSESSQSALKKAWVLSYPLSAQRRLMPRLIWVFAGRTCHFVGFIMRRLLCVSLITCSKAQPDYDPLYEDIFQISQAEHIGYYKANQSDDSKERHQFQEPHRSEPCWKWEGT